MAAYGQGIDRFDDASDEVVVAHLIGRGRQVDVRVARALLDSLGGLKGLSECGVARFCRVAGMTTAGARRLVASTEVSRRVARTTLQQRALLQSASDVAKRYCPVLGTLRHEELWVVSLTRQSRVCGERRLVRGGRGHLTVTSVEILRAALHDGADAIILVHNHPSGDPTPSTADVEMTRNMVAACVTVGVPLLDHVIVAGGAEFASVFDDDRIEDGIKMDDDPQGRSMRVAATGGSLG